MFCSCADPIIDLSFLCILCQKSYKSPRTSGIKINFIGWYGKNNIGDDSFESVFRGAFSGHDLVFSHKPDPTAEAYILGGGGVVDYGYFDGLEKLLDRPMYAVGVDIPLSGPAYDLLRGVPFKRILVRSKEYFWLAREQGLKNVSHVPDLAFWLDVPERTEAPTTIGISLMQHMLSDNKHLQGHISRVLHRKKGDHELHFLVFKPEDELIIQEVLSINPLPHKILKPETPEEMLECISKLGVLLTMRFHGAVFANLCRVPFISLSNPGKHSLFCEQEELHDSFLDIRDMNEYKLLAALNRMLKFKARGNPSKNHTAVRNSLLEIRKEIERSLA